MVGAQDEIIFDGQSLFVNSKGEIVYKLAAFKEDSKVLSCVGKKWISPNLNTARLTRMSCKIPAEEWELRSALVLGIRDFCRKTGFNKVHLGLSGGVDSGLVAALASEAMGPENVLGLFMPTEFTSKESGQLARDLALKLKIEYREFPIQHLFEQHKLSLKSLLGFPVPEIVFENLQARIRAVTLMAVSNSMSSLLLGTSNKSELAMGYSTLYGDLAGGLLPIGDLLKKQVVSVAKTFSSIPEQMINRSPTAELRHEQIDEAELGPYATVDQFVENALTKFSLHGGSPELQRRLLRSEFKRWQAPPILKVSRHAFGRGRRWPIAHQMDLLNQI
jgi:NAD+ synthase (glutamine-hydrolysing)